MPARLSALRCSVPALAALVVASAGARAQPTFSVTFNDPSGLLTPWQAQLRTSILAAADVWGFELRTNSSFDIVVIADTSIPRATGRSFVAATAYTSGTLVVSDQGFGYEARTGVDPNGADPDIEITLNPAYVASEFWFDPDPLTRTATVPNNRLDAISVFTHELGHALVYNGYINDFDGTYNDQFRSTLDILTRFDGANFFYTGAAGQAAYGGPIPLTYGNTDHWGNYSPRPGQDLILELMNGMVFQYGRRYYPSTLDRAVLTDTGLPRACPPDFDRNGTLDVQDIFAYLSAWFAGSWKADFDHSGALTVQDIFAFLNAWFAGC